MKSTTTKLMFATAVVALTTGVASAQALKAEIPFAFRAGDAVMSPGTYTVRPVEGTAPMLHMRNEDNNKSILLMPGPAASPAKEIKAKGDPVLTFLCGPGKCTLTGLWTGGDRVITFPSRGPGKTEGAVAMIRLARVTTR